MIVKTQYWDRIIGFEPHPSPGEITGKWLYFGSRETLSNLAPQIDDLANKGLIRHAMFPSIERSKNVFPHKNSVLCVFTGDAQEERDRVYQLFLDRFGVRFQLWKSDKETQEDWGPVGWLNLEYKVTTFLDTLEQKKADGELTAWNITHLEMLVRQLEHAISNIQEPDKVREIELSNTKAVIAQANGFCADNRQLS